MDQVIPMREIQVGPNRRVMFDLRVVSRKMHSRSNDGLIIFLAQEEK